MKKFQCKNSKTFFVFSIYKYKIFGLYINVIRLSTNGKNIISI